MKPEHILVVDDEPKIVANITRCLSREGFRVTGAANGSEAVALFREQQFDLVLLDMSMPVMDGYEAMEHLFAMDPDVLIIIMTGFASVESAVKTLRQGAWDFLKKPFEYAELVKTVQNGVTQRNLLDEKRAFAARLEASEQQYQYMVNNSPDLIFTLDTRGCFTFVNHQFETVLGFPRNVLSGMPFVDLLHEDDRGRAKGLILAVTSGKQGDRSFETNFEINVRFKKASNRHAEFDPYAAFAFMELKASAITLPGDDPDTASQGVYGVARDVSDRLMLEDQLRQAQKMEALGTLAGGIAHDFNNILMGIQGYASLVKAGFDKDSKAYRRLSSIDEYVNNGAEMARQLLGFAQKNCHEDCKLNMNYLLKMSAKMFGRTKKDIIIEQHLDKELWPTVVDEGQLKRVLMNLYVNAWQAMPNGGKITICSDNLMVDAKEKHTLGLDNTGAYVRISVADTGAGMDKATMARIFDPFFTTKERGQGTGLGLATAYGIVKSHKGTFQVESGPDKGSVFMFYLPAAEGYGENTCAYPGDTPDEVARIVAGRGRILLVDDERGVIEVCSEMIEALGYEVLVAESGLEAVTLLETETAPVDLVILDMVMPGMNGFETYEKIRKISPDSRVLVCSGYSKEEEVLQMIERGCDDYLYKPFDVAMLSEKLQAVFRRSVIHKQVSKT
ncbi:MAG TPA: hybrid sensor histidine kinase/response regulator [Desulfobacteraceae bacterium]|nr:hybrid sensor histidine kinase/response regulator [Desulfobacteraceae bacterium]